MQFMVIVKATGETEGRVMPSTEMLAAMGRFNEEMVKAGVMVAGEGLHPTDKAARLSYGPAGAEARRGPFDLTADTIGGFWIIETASLDEAIEWMKRALFEQ